MLDGLEREHRRADWLHAQVDRLGREYLQVGHLLQPGGEQFQQAVAELASIYKKHIQIEDDLIFPLAKQVLSEADKASIGQEMSARRR
jgi:hemerythrin-like domain-containing protein